MNIETTKCQPVYRPADAPGLELWSFSLVGGPFCGHQQRLPVSRESCNGDMVYAEILDHTIYVPIGMNFAKYAFRLNTAGGQLVHAGTFSAFDRMCDQAKGSLRYCIPMRGWGRAQRDYFYETFDVQTMEVLGSTPPYIADNDR